ncbi:SigE family RNA polymerase sigma factor [Phytoactinopolyspora mesophila]|uniref:SigE family RNA polymerase sigma factor n=1 Tax=Phytoactinopolyspora mesophila TaxID=2650750 RepID=A0A7K3M9X7_9ACTN|nr:SigE family RNA polymerase sigma factor [Phytoactinopolyspora mesophila]
MDTDGFTEFVANRGPALLRMALALTADRALAEDLVQEALARAVSRWGKLLRDGDPERYIRAVMLNETRSQWRRRARRHEVITDQVPEPAATDGTEHGVAHRIDMANVLKHLTPRQRAIIYLRYYEDVSVAETAALMKCSPGTVKRQSSDALKRIRRLAPELMPDNDAAEREVT